MPKINVVSDKVQNDPRKDISTRRESQRRGSEGKGLNEKTLNESLADLNQGVDITE